MEKMLQEFIAFAKESFGVNVTVSESDAPDSFEKIFGCSFLQEADQHTIPDWYSDERLEYNNYVTSFAADSYMDIVECNVTAELELAA